jgi:hypothetical protein
MKNLSNTTKFHLAYLLAGLVVGLVLAFPAVRVATPKKVVTHRVTASYKLQNGASAQSVFNTLGSPARTVTQTLAGHQYQCGIFVGQSSQTPDWYALYCFRAS